MARFFCRGSLQKRVFLLVDFIFFLCYIFTEDLETHWFLLVNIVDIEAERQSCLINPRVLKAKKLSMLQ